MPSTNAPPIADPDVSIRFADSRREYNAGESLRAVCAVHNADALECRSAEVSVLWRTVGKGDEDLHVHYFERLLGEDARLSSPFQLEVQLPESPLSYDGLSVKICWCVRVRLNLGGYRTHVTEAPFRLGRTAPPEPREAT
ncbi:hypothetical protein KOR34_13060 [Posidoniimonas corsicana]|uniref:Arrestin-like N-terminal domain-containing protein n=1 Tax=Posidoniimonas corsicana TaxID=1938618 RepID=A0A5C5VE09_9BACT|nr:hypothetical protein [Posidoniimonas corsicana]TWT36401.1 hypothetical protein KOR34_13060 [Posidoniimonas corsicana]